MPSAPSVFRRQLHSPFTATVYTGPPIGFPRSSWETFGLDEGQRTPHGDLVCWREGEHAWLELRGSKGRVPGTYLLRAELSDETLDEHSRVYEWAFDLQDTYSVCTPL